MKPAESFKHFRASFLKRLARLDFSCRKDLLWRKVNDSVVVVEIQKDRKCSAEVEVRFTVNIGISIDALRDFLGAAVCRAPSDSHFPPPELCHWRERLGRLLAVQSDRWWSVRDEQSAHAICEEIASSLIDIAWPKVEAMASSEAMIRSWQNGHGQGLTEYERRVNLARLLIALGRNKEAQEALFSLKKASLGKSWETSAAYDVNELRMMIS